MPWLLDALTRLAELPPEPGTPERTDAARGYQRATELEREVMSRLPADPVRDWTAAWARRSPA
jgi:hypothetical protein